jgi:hypothetical protein
MPILAARLHQVTVENEVRELVLRDQGHVDRRTHGGFVFALPHQFQGLGLVRRRRFHAFVSVMAKSLSASGASKVCA